MKSYFLLMLSAGIAVQSMAQNKSGAALYLTKSLAGETIRNLRSETSGGNITVTGVAALEARIEVYISRNNNQYRETLTKEEIQKKLDADYDLDVSVKNGTVMAAAKPKRRNMDWKQALSISFALYVPQTVSADLTTSGGNIDLTNLSGDKKFTTSGGNLTLHALSGKSKGLTSGGNVYVTQSKDDIDLTTSGGNVEAVDCTGDLHLTTSGGNLKWIN